MESKQIEWRQNTHMQMLNFICEEQWGMWRCFEGVCWRDGGREADKVFHSTPCTLLNLFFTACYPPKSMKPPVGWATMEVTRGVWSQILRGGSRQKTGGGSHGDRLLNNYRSNNKILTPNEDSLCFCFGKECKWRSLANVGIYARLESCHHV